MPDTRISDLPAASALGDADVAPIVQGGVTKKATGAQFKTYLASTTGLVPANNLSDLANAATARTNLGLGTAATQASTAFAAATHTHAAADIVSGIIASARLGTGTASSSTFLRGDGSWQAVAGGAEVNALAMPAAVSNPSSPYTPTGLTGSSIVRITGITSAKTINAPTITGVSGRLTVVYEITATGGPFTITPGTNFTWDGTGVQPTLTVPSGGLLQWITYSNDGTNWFYSGVALDTITLVFEIANPTTTVTPKTLLRGNFAYGSVVSVLAETDTGSVSGNLLIADWTSSSNFALTNGASVAGLGAMAITSTPTEFLATAGSATALLAKTGTADRGLQLGMTVTGSPTVLRLEVRVKL